MSLVERMTRLTFWQWVFVLLTLGGLYATYLRVVHGLGGSTNLTNQFPWGLWIGFDVLCGVGLAAGGFTLAAAVHIFNIETYKPILRATILTAFLGYLLVIVALLYDLGQPFRIWHPLAMWNPRSVMFEVAWCVMLYTTVLALEFAPTVFERFGWKKPLRWARAVSIPLVVAGVILSTLHQSSLGSLYLIVPHKLDPLWYTPLLPFLFFVSAICVGFAMVIFESWHSSRAFGKQLEAPLLASMARVLAVLLSFYLVLRFLDLARRDALGYILRARTESYLFGLEILLMLVPMLLLFRAAVRRSPPALYGSAVMVILGFVANRLNVSVTGMELGSGTHYIPKWSEVVITLWIIALGFAIFRFAAKHLPIFATEAPQEESLPARAAPVPGR
jgi:Ni/Fe-hydrogenase subunit HybB-like protein